MQILKYITSKYFKTVNFKLVYQITSLVTPNFKIIFKVDVLIIVDCPFNLNYFKLPVKYTFKVNHDYYSSK